MNISVEALEAALGYEFKNKKLLKEALTHPSKSSKKKPSYQRLEFLGDSVIQLITAEKLFLRFPQSDEGTMSKIRASLVSRQALSSYAKKLNLGKHIELSPALEKNKGRENERFLEDCFEA